MGHLKGRKGLLMLDVNHVADSIMLVNHVRICDVESAVEKDTAFRGYYVDGVHVNAKGVALMADAVVASIREALEEKKRR